MTLLALIAWLAPSALANELEHGYTFGGHAYLAESWGEHRQSPAAYRRNGIGAGVGVRGGVMLLALRPVLLGAAVRLNVGVGGQSSDLHVGDHTWSDVGIEATAQVGVGSERVGVIFEIGPTYLRDSALGERLGRRSAPGQFMTRLRAEIRPVMVSVEWAVNRHIGLASEVTVAEKSGLFLGAALTHARYGLRPTTEGVLHMGGTTGTRVTAHVGVKY